MKSGGGDEGLKRGGIRQKGGVWGERVGGEGRGMGREGRIEGELERGREGEGRRRGGEVK